MRHVPPWFPGAWFSKFAHSEYGISLYLNIIRGFASIGIRPLIEELKEYGVDLVERNVVG